MIKQRDETMNAQPRAWESFLADLNSVCPTTSRSFSGSFLKDLEDASAGAEATSSQVDAEIDLALLASDLNLWRTNSQQLLQKLLQELPEDDPLHNPVSLFGSLDYGRLETAHTRALAWLLGNREHGFGFKLLEALLFFLTEREGDKISHICPKRVESEFPVECGPRLGDIGRIDIFAEGTWFESGNEVPWLLVIEAKVDADEGEEQLSQYDSWLERNSVRRILRVFLTPDGHEAETSSCYWQCITFLEFASVIRRESLSLKDKPGYHFLRYYLSGVLRDVCGLPVPISPNSRNIYAAVDYLQALRQQARE